MKGFITVLTLFILFKVNAQVKIQGRVIDSESLEPISYADILLPELNISTTTNTDGTFYIESSTDTDKLVISKQDYEKANFVLESKIDYDFLAQLFKKEEKSEEVLTDDTVDLQTAVVKGKKKRLKKKENPAYAILREVWKHKKKNGLELIPNYEYNEYEKLQFDISNVDSAFMKKKIFKGMEFIFDKVDTSSINGKTYLPAFLNESIYKVAGINKPKSIERRELIANKTSGFEQNEIVSTLVKNLFRGVDIYDNRINVLDIKFVSPIASDGFTVYDYELRDTVDVDGVESYRIKYYPRREGELTFKGDLYISKEGYAVKEIVMESTRGINVNFVRNIFMDLQFDIPNDTIFYPKKQYAMLDMSLASKKESARGIFAHKTVNYYNYDFQKKYPQKYYEDRIDPNKMSQNEKSDQFWQENRPEVLTKSQEGIYSTLEELSKVPKFNNIIKTIEVLGSGYYNVGKSIDLGNIYSLFGYNEIEGQRLRLDARTFFSQNDMWRIHGFLAYGFKDNKFKYGLEYRHMFNKFNRFQIGVGTKRDVEQLATQLTDFNSIITRSFASSSIINQGDNLFLSNNNLTNVYTAIDPWQNITFRLDANFQTIKPAAPEYFSIDYEKDGQIKKSLTNSSLSLSITAQPGAKYIQNGIDRYLLSSSLSPILMVRYTKGLKGVINSDFEYDKLQFLYSQPFLVGSFGKSIILFEAGKTFKEIPLSLMSPIPGNESYGSIYGTFALLNYYEFVTDQYATINWEHQFKGWIFNKIPLIKRAKLRELTFLRAAYGNISERNKAINRSTIEYFAPNKQIYYEYGFGIENIGYGNIRPIRVDFNWRGNYLNLPNARKFGVTIGLNWNF